MRTHEIRPSVKCTILMRKHEKKYFCAQSRHTQGTVVARFLESLGTVWAQFRHSLGTVQAHVMHKEPATDAFAG